MTPIDIRNRLEMVYTDILNTSIVDWSSPIAKYSKEEIFEQSYKDICAIMDSMNQNFFLNTKSEVSIDVKLKDNVHIKGRIDFIHKDAITPDILIFDGKGTDKLGKNVDENQLLFYALQYYFHYKVLPSQLGFFYYRFNAFKPVNINIDIMNEFRAKLSLDIKKMLEENFTATPCSKSCRYCDYRLTCSDLREYAAKRKKKSKIEFPSNEEICEFGFNI
jgi:CRISPR/Cas system-associated exonuclease Cas4 (RecB family)